MKNLLKGLLFFLFLLILIPVLYFHFSDCGIAPFACGDYATEGNPQTKKISLGSGPEDMGMDYSQGYPRIIVSCDDRRANFAKNGAFYQINLSSNKAAKFQIIPADFIFHPHGIDVVTIDSIPYLYAISHDPEGEKIRHRIIRFEIKKDSLLLDNQFVLEHPKLRLPNDLDVLADGSLYATNYLKDGSTFDSFITILGAKTGDVVHYDGKGNWETVVEDMCYPNGIWVNEKENYLLVANGGCKEVVRYKINNGKIDQSDRHSTKYHDVNIPIGDNLLLDNQGVLWTAAHPCPTKFLGHATDSQKHSPVQVFAMDPMTLKTSLVYQNNGEMISAASTVLQFNNRLYISQVFDPFVLVVADF